VQFKSATSHIDRLATVVEHGHLLAACLAAVQYSPVQVLAAQIRSMTVDQHSALLSLDTGVDVRAKLIVAADGANSKCRETAGIPASRKQYQQTAFVANLRAERMHNGLARQWFAPQGVIALLPMPQADVVNLVWSAPDDLTDCSIGDRSAELFLKFVQPLALPALGALRLIDDTQSVPLQQVLATQLIGPRLVLIGDAAHAIHPMAGHGLNLGFGDIEVLTEVLAQRSRSSDIGARQLLRRYERARAEPIMQMAFVTDGLYRLFFQDVNSGLSKTVRDIGWSFISRSSWLRKQMIDHASKN
jgi:2-polyprenylphenol 6-hydroxylase